MPDEYGERLARLEEQVRRLRKDMDRLAETANRSRARLRTLETTTSRLKFLERGRTRQLSSRQRRLELRIEVLTLLVLVASIAIPLVITFGHG